MMELPNSPFASMDPAVVATFGTPAGEITTWIDTSAWADQEGGRAEGAPHAGR